MASGKRLLSGSGFCPKSFGRVGQALPWPVRRLTSASWAFRQRREYLDIVNVEDAMEEPWVREDDAEETEDKMTSSPLCLQAILIDNVKDKLAN